jgi:drug/metabolite transporter (DMT)-like permease
VGTHLIGKGTLNAIGPLSTALLRFLTASAAFLVILLARGSRSRIARADVPKILWLGLLAVPLNQSCFLFGLSQSTASHASLLYALTPLCVLLLARKVLHEENVGAKLLGVLAALVGCTLIFLDGGLAHELAMMRGDLLLLMAVIAWAVYTTSSKELLARYDPLTLTGWSIIAGTVMTLPAALLPGAIPPLASLTAPIWGGILYLAVGTSVVAYALWNYALRRIDASKVAITTNAQPVLTSVLSWVLFHDRFGPAFFGGAALILFGVTWVETRGKGTARRAEPAVA